MAVLSPTLSPTIIPIDEEPIHVDGDIASPVKLRNYNELKEKRTCTGYRTKNVAF